MASSEVGRVARAGAAALAWSAGRLCGDCSWSEAVEVLVEGALLGLGVDFLRLLVDGVVRGPRGLPLGQP
jgi:hypothetical protein